MEQQVQDFEPLPTPLPSSLMVCVTDVPPSESFQGYLTARLPSTGDVFRRDRLHGLCCAYRGL